MLILCSPAKTLDFESPRRDDNVTQPSFLDKAEQLVAVLRTFSSADIADLLEVNAELAELNYTRFQDWSRKHTSINSRTAINAFKGDVYRQFHPDQYTKKQLVYLQKSVRIFSGLYGLLRPYDLIQPYRLEMKTTLKTGDFADLFEFWKNDITTAINDEIAYEEHGCIVDLSSQEYARAIDYSRIHIPVYRIEFSQRTEHGLKKYFVLVRQARGSMINWLIQRCSEKISDLERFHEDGYECVEKTDLSMHFIKPFYK